MTRFVAGFHPKFNRYARMLAISLFALLFLGACYQEVPVSSTPTPEVIEVPDGAAPTQSPVKEPEKKPETGEKPAGNETGGGGGGGGAATPLIEASPTASCLATGMDLGDPTVAALPTCTPISGVRLPGTPVTRPGTAVATVAGAVKTPISGTKPVVTPPATVKSGTVPTVKPGTTPAGGVKTVAAPTVKSGTTPMVPTVKAGSTAMPTVSGSPSTTAAPGVTVSPGTKVPTVSSPLLPTMTPSATTSATTESSTEMGLITVTKRENFANAIIPGACFSLVAGDTVAAPICDQQEGDKNAEPGVIGIEAAVGAYTLRETTPPEGYEAGADIEVQVAAGTPTAIDVINHLIKTTDTLTINKVDTAGAALPDSCFDIVGGDGAVTNVCDGGPNDLNGNAGAIQIEVNSGDYLLRETPPAGYAPTEAAVSVIRGEGATVQVVNAAATPSQEPTTASATGVFLANIVGADGATMLPGVCLTLTGPTTYSFCDGDGSDQDPTDGFIEVVEIMAGDYSLTATPPEGLVALDPMPVVTIVEASVFTSTLRFGPAAETTTEPVEPTVPVNVTVETEPTVAPDGIVLVQSVLEDGRTPLPGVCLNLIGSTTFSVCDNGEGDPEPTEGVIELDVVPVGDYSVEITAPEGYELASELPALRVESGTPTPLNLTFRATQTIQTGLVIVQSLLEDGVTTVTGVCVNLTGATTISACDNGEGDVEPTEGTIELDAVSVGDYSVEVTAPEGYELASELPALRVESGTPTPLNLTFRATQTTQTGLVIVQALLEDGVTAVAGVCVNLTGATTVSACDNGEGDVEPTEGTIEFQPMPVGEYAVEVVPGEGFEVAAEVPATIQVVVDVPAQFAIALRAVTLTGSLQITKVDAADGATLLAGSCFELTGPAGTYAICDDDENDRDELTSGDTAGVVLIAGLPVGEYTVHESQAPAGYDLAADQVVTIVQNETAGLMFADAITVVQVTGNLQVLLTDEGGNAVPGACLSLIPQFGDGAIPTVDLCDGGESEGEADGQLLFPGLAPGIYQLTETAAPAGYRIPEATQVEIPAEGGDIQTSIVHTASTGSLLITTTGPDGAPVSGACFSLIAPDGASVDWCDDDGDGSIPVDGLAEGDYIARILSLPEQFAGGEVSEQIVSIVLDQQSALNFAVNAAPPTTSSLQVLVADEQGQPLGGACIDLQGAQTARACDDVENDGDPNPGSILIAGLVPGEYSVTQSQAAADHSTAEPQVITLDPANPVTQIGLVNIAQPAGVALGIPAIYSDDIGRLWLLRPGDTQPTRLDADERPWDQRVAPIASYDHVEIAFMITNPDQPTANLKWFNLQDLTEGSVDFAGVGTPMQIGWVPGRHDLLLVAVQLPSGTSNVYVFNIENQELAGPIFPGDGEPASIDGFFSSPTSTLVAIQTTGTDGDADTWLIDSNPEAAPNLTNVGPNDGIDGDFFAGWSPAGDSLLVRSGADGSNFFITNFARTTVPVDPNPIYRGDSNSGTAPAWSADSTLVSYFDNDPAAGGQLRIARVDGTPLCDPIANVQSAVWSPNQLQLWTLMNVPDQPQSLTIVNADCSQQQLTTFDSPVSRLRWAPGTGALALLSNNDGNASLSIFAGDAIIPIDMAKANVAFADILTWSPGGEVLAIYAGGPSVSLWVVVPGSDSPVSVAGSTLPEGANYITQVWWP